MIRVCVPFYQDFEVCKPGIRELVKTGNFKPCFRQGTYIHALRNELVTDEIYKGKYEGVVKDYTHFLFIDSDIGFKKEDIYKLISYDKDIISAPYLAHRKNHYWAFKDIGRNRVFYTPNTTGLKKIDGCGFGCILIKRRVFEKLSYPYFYHPLINVNGRMVPQGEDFLFCENARKAGFMVFCDFDINICHKQRTYNSFDWEL